MLGYQGVVRTGPLGWASLAVALLVVMPIAAVLAGALSAGGDTWAHLARTVLGGYVANTALLMAGVAYGVVSMGVLSAWLVTAYRFPGQRLLEWALVLPLAMPAYVMAYAYTDWLQFTGPVQSTLRSLTGWQAREYWFPEVRSLWGAAAMLSFALYPYVYLIARTAFRDVSRSALEAGRLSGQSAWQCFWRVAVPLARPAIAAGTALALMETLADFGTVSYFGVEVLTTAIYKAWLSMNDIAAAGQLSACLLAFVVVVVAIERSNRGRAAYYSATRRPSPPYPLEGWKAWLALLTCAAPVAFGFLLPAAILGQLVLADPDALWTSRLTSLIGNSVAIAGAAAVAGMLLATVMAYAARVSRSPAVRYANRIASLGYAVPGAVIAVGILVPLGRLDNWIAGALESAFDVRVGLLLTGTVAALVYAYLARFLAVALQTMEAGLAKVTPVMDDAARSLGASPAWTLARVHAPLLASSVATAGLLLFVDVMKELPATFALRPFNFDTLAVETYNLAKDERLAEAALPSLLIVAVALLPLVFVSRRYFQATRS
ncbi:MAG: iron ABC transporter permease [Betaproteobacteria bacterium]|nr:iron ABC transporter permease [Betaproteobacteria bacterium]